jgi:GNAT superfamily N-acetyltransferase
MSDKDCLEFYKKIFPNFDENKWNERIFHSYAQMNGSGNIIGCISIIKDHEFPGIDHIWLCGVDPKYRGTGVFKRLIGMFAKHCTDEISVATYPDRWPVMYQWINKRGILVKDGEKMLFVIKKNNL